MRTFVLMMLMMPMMAIAQNQQGYVKTKGRLGNNGTVIAGQRLAGTIVQVKGRTAVVSQKNGTFSFPIPSQNYYLQSVQKQGYVLTDPDVLSKQYAFSKNPLVLVLETPSQQMDDKLAAERKIRRTLQRQLQEKEDEIESLKEQQKLSEEEYRKQLQEIYSQQESNEKLISEMADRYSKMDFDEVDEFNRRISSLIFEGKLTEADSLLNTKGDINSRATILRQHQEANAQAEQEIKKRQKKLEKSKELTQKELEDLAQDCYSKFEIFKMQHQNDSAAFYIELRASLDSANVMWQSEAGDFLQRYLAEYEKALNYYERGLRLTLGNDEAKVGSFYNDIATVYAQQGKFEKAIEIGKKAVEIHQQCLGEQSKELAKDCLNLVYSYTYLGDFNNAMKLSNRGISILEQISGVSLSDMAEGYSNLGMIYHYQGNEKEALFYFEKAINLLKEDESLVKASLFDNIASIYANQSDFDIALDYNKRALEIRKNMLKEPHPDFAISYLNIGGIYQQLKDFSKALSNFEKALENQRSAFGNIHPDVAISYNNIGAVHAGSGNYQEALEVFQKALDIRKKIFGEKHQDVATSYNNIGYVYDKLGKDTTAMDYYKKSLDIRLSVFGKIHPLVSATYCNIAILYEKQNNREMAMEFYRKSLASLPENHRNKEKIQKRMDDFGKSK